MPSLKTLRTRIQSIKSTEKITSAMRMVAAARLRRAEEKIESVRAYALGLEQMVQRLKVHAVETGDLPVNTPRLLILLTSDRGLCGAFNSNLAKEARTVLDSWQAAGMPFYIACLGRKGRDSLKKDFQPKMILEVTESEKGAVSWSDARALSQRIQDLIQEYQIGVVEIVYSRFRSALIQTVTRQQLVPYEALATEPEDLSYLDILEPSASGLLEQLLPANLAAQLYRSLCESVASEHGARMTSMDHATRNASDMTQRLQLYYNRTRQGLITRELIEVIAGADAL